MTRGLRISDELILPLDAVTQAIGILARRGAGKTYTASVLVEEVVKARQPVVVLDPTGAWWGLRSSADGEKAGLPVVILGGEHGDVPLESTAGAVIADLVVDHPGAYVVDLSGFESKAAEHRFAAAFLERLYRAKATRREPLLLVVDEADGFAPQRPGPEQTRTLGALEAIVRRGRIRGLGVVLITQRSAVLNKNVLTQIEVLVAMQTTGPQDRGAIDEWVSGNGSREERDLVLGSLASLERGEAWVWSPSWLRSLKRVRIRARETFDSSKTPEAGARAIAPRAFAKVDLEQLGERIRATAEQAKANDPVALHRRIRELEAESAARLGVIERRPEPEVRIERVEVPVLNGHLSEFRAALDDLFSSVDRLADVGTTLTTVATTIGDVGKDITSRLDRVATAPRPAQQKIQGADRAVGRTGAPDTVAPVARAVGTLDAPTGPASLGPTDRAVLATLASFPEGRTQKQVAILSGYSAKSGGFFGSLAKLRKHALIVGGAGDLRITDAGLAALGPYDPLPSGAALVDYWIGKLPKAEGTILRALIEAGPAGLSQDELGARTGYSTTSGGFFGALAKLRTLELIEGGRAALTATPELLNA